MQEKQKKHRQKRCKHCHNLFTPNVRTKGKQRYCSKEECQRKRQRENEKDWRKRNPDCVKYQYQQTRQWNKTHSKYSSKRRSKNPQLLEKNRDQTKKRMQKIRAKYVFDKSKVILMQVVGNKANKCYLTQGARWLYVRLTKASPLSKRGSMGDNRKQYKRVVNRLPKGKLYDLSQILE